MTDEAAVIRAGEAPVSDECGGFSQSLAVEQLHGLKHFRHTGSTLGACVADDNYMSILYQTFADCCIGFIFSVKANGGAFEMSYLGRDGRGLGHCCVRTKVAVHDGKASKVGKGLGHIRNYVFISIVWIVPFV